MIAAGRRFGKTVMACVILFHEALKNNDRVYWLVAPTYGQAKELAWDILIRMIPRELMSKDPNESELKITLRTGSTIHLKGADNPETLVGRGLSGLVIDEVAKIRNNKRVWEEILRPSLSDYQGFCIFISTPKGKDYFWELFTKGERKEDGYESWRFKTEDNPFIPRSEIKAAKDTLSDRYFKQEFEASFEDYVGLIWPEFSSDPRQGIVIDPPETPEWWESIAAIDTALSGTTAVLKAVIDDQGCIYVVKEYYEQNKRVSEITESIRPWEPKVWYIDPASNSQKVQKLGELYSLYDEYRDNGITAWPAENEVNGGINRVAEYFKTGKLKISTACKNLLLEIEKYHWAEERETVNGVSVPKPYKSYDHACDCLRYLVMSRPDSGKFITKITKGSLEYFERMEQRQKERREEIEEVDV